MITVIITCYKEGRLLNNAIQSLNEQTNKNFEILIVNDASPDPVTNEVCRQLEEKNGIRVIWREENGGLSAARNTGFDAMQGEIAVPLDADDVLPPNAIEDIYRAFNMYPDADFIFGDYIRRDLSLKNETLISGALLQNADGLLDITILSDINKWTLLGTSPCKKKIWKKVNGYTHKYSNDFQDVDFWMRVISAGGKGYYLNATIYVWNRSETGMNSNQPLQKIIDLWADNLAFYDKVGIGKKIRYRIINHLIQNKDYKNVNNFYKLNSAYFDKRMKIKIKILVCRYNLIFKVYERMKLYLTT